MVKYIKLRQLKHLYETFLYALLFLSSMEKAYMLINTRQGKLRIASSKLAEFEEVKEVHEVYGRVDLVAVVETNKRHELKAFIQNKIQIIEGIKNTEVLLVNDIEEDEEEPEE